MITEHRSPVQYFFDTPDRKILVNDLINSKITLRFSGEISCLKCGRATRKSFFQGFCYPCFSSAPEASECILHPEKCQAHLGFARDMRWAASHCLQTHVVYLAVSSNLKVGVTRATQVPTRWIDQGAVRAIRLAETQNRHTAGLIEVELKAYFSDKTSWQAMLKNKIPEGIDLLEEKQRAWEYVSDELKEFFTENDKITQIDFPVLRYPTKVKSINFDKTAVFSGVLIGIKGQYLIFESGEVINIRKFGGYKIELST